MLTHIWVSFHSVSQICLMLRIPFVALHPHLQNKSLHGRRGIGVFTSTSGALLLPVKLGKCSLKDILLLTPFFSEGHWGSECLTGPKVHGGKIAEPRTTNVVVFLLLHGPSPNPSTAASCRVTCPVAGNAGGRHTALSHLWSPLPAVAGVSPRLGLYWFPGCCLSGFFSLPETMKSFVFSFRLKTHFCPSILYSCSAHKTTLSLNLPIRGRIKNVD